MSPVERLTFLINPVAGNFEGKRLAENLRAAELRHVQAEVVELDLASFGEQVARAKDSDYVVIGGGDGTVSKVTAHLEGFEGKLALFPIGTANDLAKELGACHVPPQKAAAAVEQILTLPKVKLDVWELGWERQDGTRITHTFTNYCSWGFDAAVLSDVDCWRRGDLPEALRNVFCTRGAYLCFGLKRMAEGPVLSGTVNSSGGSVRGFQNLTSLLFANIRSYMGLGKSNQASNPCDQKIELVRVQSPLDYAGMMLPFGPSREVSSLNSCSVKFDFCPKYCQVDGERISIGEADEFELKHAFSLPVVNPRCPVEESAQ